MEKQINVGFNNRNTHIHIEEGNIIISADSEIKCSIKELWKHLINQFAAADERINASIHGNVLVTKTQTTELYDSSKILVSLMKIGIPLPAAIEIADKTIHEIEKWIAKNRNKETQLTTKIIRQIVSLTIENLDLGEWTRTNIEKWNIKYVRRYGHNNKTIQVYSIPQSIYHKETETISYEFVMNVLLTDIIQSIASDADISNEISKQNLRAMAEEIVDFVNNCDLYMINYGVLKSIILEIATQLPHPWFIGKDKRSKTIAYDRKSVEGNLEIARKSFSSMEALQSNIIVEILHHASSMVLEKYFSFLGCNDLTAFYRLEEIVRKIANSDATEWDSVISDYTFRDMLDDFTIAGIELSAYQEKISKIHSFLDRNDLTGRDFTRLLIDFGEMSLHLQEYGDKEKIVSFLHDTWGTYSACDICENIKTVLLLVHPPKYRSKKRETDSLHFWLVYSKCHSAVYSEIKSNIFVLVAGKESSFDYSALSILCEPGKSVMCNTILFVSEKIDDYFALSNEIKKNMQLLGIDTTYIPIILCQNDLNELFRSPDRAELLDAIIEKQLLSTDET